MYIFSEENKITTELITSFLITNLIKLIIRLKIFGWCLNKKYIPPQVEKYLLCTSNY